MDFQNEARHLTYYVQPEKRQEEIEASLRKAFEEGAQDLDTYKAWLEVFFEHMKNVPVLRSKHERVVTNDKKEADR